MTASPLSPKATRSKVIVILGPTASGKTRLAVALSRRISGEIISADSRQVYRGMDLGTGKDLLEYGEIPYHLIDIRNPGEPYSVFQFQRDALTAISAIFKRSCIPVICGGSGHYVKALIDDYHFPHTPSQLSATTELESRSRISLYQQLDRLGLWDQHHWERDSRRRMARAIEVALCPHAPLPPLPAFRDRYQPRLFYTCCPRPQLRERIRVRLEERLKAGLIEEVSGLLKAGVENAELLRLGLEYRWVSRFLSDEITYQTMQQRLETDIARFAKRQLTYLRYLEKCGHCLHPITSPSDFLEAAENWLAATPTGSDDAGSGLGPS